MSGHPPSTRAAMLPASGGRDGRSQPGVAKATVSFKDKTATVTYDDGKADVNGLTEATTNAGYPSAPKS